MKRVRALWTLFLSMLYISAFTFGGGFVIVTFMQRKFVDELHWIDEEEMIDMTALAQSAPGAISVNAAILMGWRVGGLAGMAVAVLGTILPPLVILSVISFFYAAFASNRYVALMLKGMQAGAAAVIFDVILSLGIGVAKQKRWAYCFIMVGAFAGVIYLHINVVFVILAAALIGILRDWVSRKKKGAS